MKIKLSGYNVDKELLDSLKEQSNYTKNNLTPETFSAGYARISRMDKPVDEIRRQACKDVSKARKSNKAIIFAMGHHSVAEHAVFNFDIIGISRLAIEALEKFRLCSFTEKSQRYIKLDDDYVVPKELDKAESKAKDLFIKTIQYQNKTYHELYNGLMSWFEKTYNDKYKDKNGYNELEGMAKEDARYIVSLATEGQLGMTINARSIELLFRRFASHNLLEVKEIGQILFSEVESVAPSIILFVEPNPFDEKTYSELSKIVDKFKSNYINSESFNKIDLQDSKDVVFLKNSNIYDTHLIASLCHSVSKMDFNYCFALAEKMSEQEKKETIKTACKDMQFYDTLIREFEHVNATLEMKVSASCFAQLKRHRMASITTQEYDPELGVTVPPTILEAGLKDIFMDAVHETEKAYYELKKQIPAGAADYILTNAHRRRVLMTANIRELYHISRLREDKHAQWDIRNISTKITKKVKENIPIGMMLAGGKNSYESIYSKIYGQKPKVSLPEELK